MEQAFKIGDRVAVVQLLPIYEEVKRGTVVGFLGSYVQVRVDRPDTAMVEGQEEEPQPTNFQPDELVKLDA
jgi:hypothetical protein